MKLQTRGRAATVLVSSTAVGLLGATAAYAVWSTSGSGQGSAVATTSKDLTLTATGSANGLYPTGTSTGSIDVKNPNGFAVTISNKGFGSVGVTKAGVAVPGCTPTTVTFGFGASQPTSIAASQTVSIPFTATMSNAAEDACQGATFTSTLTVTGASS